MRKALRLEEEASSILKRLGGMGALMTSVDKEGQTNVMTIGWGLIGRSYHGNPMFIAAVCPPRYTWKLLEETGEFVVAIGDESLREATELCGTKSGRDTDKFKAAGLTQIPSIEVKAPSIKECRINIECRTYFRQQPPHMILTPEHRKKPIGDQHTIYFAEILGVYSGYEEEEKG